MTSTTHRIVALLAAVSIAALACASDTATSTGPTTAGPTPDAPTTTGQTDGDRGDANGGAGDGGAVTGASVDPALAFVAPRLGGGADLDGTSLTDTAAVLWFWAPWCTTCRGEAPTVAEVAEEFDGRVPVIGVAGRGPVADMEAFVDQTGTGGFEHVVDGDGSIWAQFGVVNQPAFAFVGTDGEVEVVPGRLAADELRARLEALTN